MLGAFVVERKKVVCGWFHICKNTSISAGMKKNEHPFFCPIDDPSSKGFAELHYTPLSKKTEIRAIQDSNDEENSQKTQNLDYVAPS